MPQCDKVAITHERFYESFKWGGRERKEQEKGRENVTENERVLLFDHFFSFFDCLISLDLQKWKVSAKWWIN